MKAFRIPLVGSMVIGALLLMSQPQPAFGASYVVDNTDDDPGLAKQACLGAADDCSLRGAITRANAASSPGDVITFDAVVFAPGTITIASALPTLTGGSDTIDGTAATVVVRGKRRARRLQLLDSRVCGQHVKGPSGDGLPGRNQFELQQQRQQHHRSQQCDLG
jgi:hypothetical protein